MIALDRMMAGLRPLLALIVLSGSVAAQDWNSGAAMRAIEKPGHDALMALIEHSATELAVFETDGCSGGLSAAWRVVANHFPGFAQTHQHLPPWEGCCVMHDKAYHNAGIASDATDSFEARLTADLALKTCVAATGTNRADALANVYQLSPDQVVRAYDSIAATMFLAVRIGGAPCSGMPWRWGYGYPSCSVLAEAF